mmetsp:Transcript_22272/g.51051  ORF Transcript_22272/g.51051 Transcript_22272/m.51051 type:complete len:210 (-) Transcript_22272:163-792(-)
MPPVKGLLMSRLDRKYLSANVRGRRGGMLSMNRCMRSALSGPLGWSKQTSTSMFCGKTVNLTRGTRVCSMTSRYERRSSSVVALPFPPSISRTSSASNSPGTPKSSRTASAKAWRGLDRAGSQSPSSSCSSPPPSFPPSSFLKKRMTKSMSLPGRQSPVACDPNGRTSQCSFPPKVRSASSVTRRTMASLSASSAAVGSMRRAKPTISL